MRKNNKYFKACADLLNVIAKNVKWDDVKENPYEEMLDNATSIVSATMKEYGFDSDEKHEIFLDFYDTLHSRLYNKLENKWLSNRLTDDWMSDDGYHYFLNEILAHGYDAYEAVMKNWEEAKKYANDYDEGFEYCIYRVVVKGWTSFNFDEEEA